MPKKPSVRYFPSRGAYYCQHKGRQHKLAVGPDDSPTGPTFLAAVKQYGQILALDNAPRAKDENTLGTVFELYLQHIHPRRKHATYILVARHLNDFGHYVPAGTDRPCGQLRISELTFAHVEQFCDAMRRPRQGALQRNRVCRWGEGTVRVFLQCVQAALNWAAKPGRGLIHANPLKGIETPGQRSRGAEMIVSPELHERVLALASAGLRELVLAIHNTGARPGELAAASSRDWNDELGAIVYLADDKRVAEAFSHKNASKGKDRTIYFTGECLAMVRDLARRHPTGKLFRPRAPGVRNEHWTGPAITGAFTWLQEQLGMPKLTAYSYRHTYITRALEAGIPPVIVAELVGNSPGVIFRHYSHVDANKKGMRKAAEAIHSRVAEAMAPVAEAMALLEEYMGCPDAAKLEQALAKLQAVRAGSAGSRPAVLPFAGASSPAVAAQ
jgi:integrase